MNNSAGAAQQIIVSPKGGGAQKGIGEKFAPDLQTGTGNFLVPTALPPGHFPRGGGADRMSSLISNSYICLAEVCLTFTKWTATHPPISARSQIREIVSSIAPSNPRRLFDFQHWNHLTKLCPVARGPIFATIQVL